MSYSATLFASPEAATTSNSSDVPQSPEELAAAFAPLLAYDARLFNVAFRILRDRDDALDAVQDAYVQAFRGFHRFRGDSHPYTWLCRITLNECSRRGGKRTARRKREVELSVLEELGAPLFVEDSAFPRIDLRQTSHRIADAVAALPKLYREMVRLRYFDHLSYRQVAEITGCPVGTVKSRLSRAHDKLRTQLEPAMLGEFA